MLKREAYGCSAGYQNLYGYSDIGDVEKYQMFQSSRTIWFKRDSVKPFNLWADVLSKFPVTSRLNLSERFGRARIVLTSLDC